MPRFEINESQSFDRILTKKNSSELSPLLSLSAIEPRIICDDVTDAANDVIVSCKTPTGSRDDGRATKEIVDNGNTNSKEDTLKTKERSRLKTKRSDEDKDSSVVKSKALLCLYDEDEYEDEEDEVIEGEGQEMTQRNANAAKGRGHNKGYGGGFVEYDGQSGGNDENDRKTKTSQRKVGKSRIHSTLCLIS